MTKKRFNCHFKFSKMPNGIMVLDYTKHGDEQLVIEDISRDKAHRVMDKLNELADENEQLKQRNDRQAKRLAELYELMAKKDWESLTEIIDDFCSCEGYKPKR